MVWHSLKRVYVRFKRPMPTLQEFLSIRMEKAKCTVVYHLAQGVKTVLPREPFVPAAYIEQLVDKEVQWEIDLVQITGDGSKPENYEAIARLDYAKFLESLPSAFYHQLDANQLEVQPS